MKVFVLVVCAKDANKGEYDKLTRAIQETWGKDETDNVKVFYLWCENYARPDARNYVLKKPEGYGMLLWKSLGFLAEHRHDDFDYIFRVNVGSYVHLQRLYDHLLSCPREKFYSGQPGKIAGIPFVSGTGFILSRDLVLMMLDHIDQFGFDHIDDVAIGRFFQDNGIPITEDWTRATFGHGMHADEKSNTYHWKLRHADGERWIDCEHMKILYNRFNNGY